MPPRTRPPKPPTSPVPAPPTNRSSRSKNANNLKDNTVSPESDSLPPPKTVAAAAPARVTRKRGGGTTAAAPKAAYNPRGVAKPKSPPALVNSIPAPPAHLRPSLKLFGWASNEFGQLGVVEAVTDNGPPERRKPMRNMWVESKIEEGLFGEDGAGLETVAAGGMHTLFVDEKGTIWACGNNDDAALGIPNGEQVDLVYTPVPLQSLVDEGFRAVKVFAGDNISLAISSSGDLRIWGTFKGNNGYVGFPNGAHKQFVPMPILALPDEKLADAVAGPNHVLLLTTLGNVFTFGSGEEGQLGRRVIERRKIHGTVPEKIVVGGRGRKMVTVGTGWNHSFAVDTEGVVWGWGVNNHGQTGTGVHPQHPQTDFNFSTPRQVLGLSSDELDGDVVTQIAGGQAHTVFLTSRGRVYACGLSDEGRLGLADDDVAFEDRAFEDSLPVPARVTFPDGDDDPVVQVSCGTNHTLAVTRDGAMYSWGRQVQGELGLNSEEGFVKTPTTVVKRSGGAYAAVMASAGGTHCLALLRKRS
ncbi:regulator of chromosome condensation 1/beta-lactamase-inhibitor protein II [Amylostereum chailletii]|nr:regulator of chromosome condensation 1/beta-lactamase-inhibitor protein II [Amylostereum chailletii]